MQRERHYRCLGTTDRLLVGETDCSVADIVFEVKVPEGIGVNDDIEIITELDTPLLEAQVAPALQDFGI